MKNLLFAVIVIAVMLVLTDHFFLHGMVAALVSAVQAAI